MQHNNCKPTIDNHNCKTNSKQTLQHYNCTTTVVQHKCETTVATLQLRKYKCKTTPAKHVCKTQLQSTNAKHNSQTTTENRCSSKWLRKTSRSLPRAVKKNIQEVHLMQSSRTPPGAQRNCKKPIKSPGSLRLPLGDQACAS